MKYNEDLKQYLANAEHLSAINHHEFITCEHLLFALLKLSPDFRGIFNECADGEFSVLENELKNHIAQRNQILSYEVRPMYSVVLDEILTTLNKGKTSPKIIDFLEGVSKDERTYSKFLLEKHALNLDKIKELKNTPEVKTLRNAQNLTTLAKEGKLEPLVGREFELNRMMQVLSRRKKSNPILVGEAGVGKTAIVEGLALAIAQKKVPKNLQDTQIYAFDMSSSKSALKDIINELAHIPNSILFLDEIHTLVDKDNHEISNDIKPALSNGTLKCIGATTFLEYRNSFAKNKGLSRRFAKIDVDEPSKDEALLILKGVKSRYEDFHGVKFNDEVLESSVELSKKLFQDKFLPDSAIELIDELGASFIFKESKKEANLADLDEVAKKMTHSHKTFGFDKVKMFENLENELKKQIFGQDEVIESVCATLKQSYAGFKTSNSPRGVFLFTGSSGVGKTELCRVLAQSLGLHFERFDMSEYFDKHEISRFIGSPSGYVGHEEGGILTNAVRANPYSVVLFDEVEKADPKVSNVFLQIFDSATLTDGAGLKADFQNTIIVMTSNLGLKESNELGFLSKDEAKSDRAIKEFFAPEFINRIDKILHFKDLNDESLEKIVQKELNLIAANLKNISIQADLKVKKYLVQKVQKKEFGARLLKRIIAEEVSEKLSDEILFGRLKNGGLVKLTLKNNAVEFAFSPLKS